MKEQILEHLPAECPWRDTLYWFDTVTSTNDLAKDMAKNNAHNGTIILSGHQSAGRGRMGRSFSSPDGKGIYLSLILRPQCPPEKLMHLTCAVGVAACDAIEEVAGVRPGIKWINDLVLGKKKLGGILTELSTRQGLVDNAVVGIGINCSQKTEDFPAEIRDIAISLEDFAATPVDRSKLIAALISHLHQMNTQLFLKDFITPYRKDCITLGQEISVVAGEDISHGKAVDLDAQGGLIVQYSDGTCKTVNAGEVSIRGMYGYV